MTPLPPPPILADGTPYVPGMPLWHCRFGRVELAREHIRTAPLEWYGGDGWFIGCHSINFFHGTRAGAVRELIDVLRVRKTFFDRGTAESAAESARLAAEIAAAEQEAAHP